MMDKDKFLKKLAGEEKGAYLRNLLNASLNVSDCMDNTSIKTQSSYGPLHKKLFSLIKILEEGKDVEVDLSTGLPSIVSMLKIDNIGKSIEKEKQDLKSKLSSQVKISEGKESSQMLVERIKSKIYSFDTFAAEELRSEGTQFHELLNAELALRDRMYLLSSVSQYQFTTDPEKIIQSGDSRGLFYITGFDSRENRFVSYLLQASFLSHRKKMFENEYSEYHKLKPKYDELFVKHFLAGDADSMFKAFLDTKRFWPEQISKTIVGPYLDYSIKESVDGMGGYLRNPGDFVLEVSWENVAPSDSFEHYEEHKKTGITKENLTYKITSKDLFAKLTELYKGDETVKVCTVG